MTVNKIEFVHASAVTEIVLNNPQKANALSRGMIGKIADAVGSINRSDDCMCVLIHGTGANFCAGIDLSEPPTPSLERQYLDGIGDREAISRLRQPVIAVIEGKASGAGAELALMADIVIMSETASMQFPEISFGSLPGAGGCVRLTDAIGEKPAAYYLLTGEAISATEALALGLVSKVAPHGEALNVGRALAEKISKAPQHATWMLKDAIRANSRINEGNRLNHERLLSTAALSISLSRHLKD
ncbi:MAG: enoyl-CoA hydratase/isomerase family protein [Parvibaculaceae bacterium]